MEIVDFGHSADAPLNAQRHRHVMVGALSVSDLTYDNGAGGRARATLIVPPRPNGTAVVLAQPTVQQHTRGSPLPSSAYQMLTSPTSTYPPIYGLQQRMTPRR